MGDAIFADRDEFAIDHGVRLRALKCFRDLHVGVADNLPVTAIERDATTAHETVPAFSEKISENLKGKKIGKLKRTYWDVAPGKPLALIGSSGLTTR